MRILANENVAAEVVERLRGNGYDVAWVRHDSPGATDDAVLERAVTEQRVLITFDKDFGQLVFLRGRAASCGVVLFRIAAPSPTAVAENVTRAIHSRSDWVGHFSVVDDRQIRMTSLPSSTGE